MALVSDQAEASVYNPGAGTTQARILIELQVISYLLHQNSLVTEDLKQIRDSIAASILSYSL